MTMKNVGQKLKDFTSTMIEVGQRRSLEMGLSTCGWAAMLMTLPDEVAGTTLPKLMLLYGALVMGQLAAREARRFSQKWSECYAVGLFTFIASGVAGACFLQAYDSWVNKQQSPISYAHLETAKADIVARCPALKDEANVGDYAWKITETQTLNRLDPGGNVSTEKRLVARIDHDVILPARPGERPRVRHDTTDVAFVRQGDGTCLEMK
jgi:hypothetical protein